MSQPDAGGAPEHITNKELRERLEKHRERLEQIAEMDVPATEDAKRALAFLDEEGQS